MRFALLTASVCVVALLNGGCAGTMLPGHMYTTGRVLQFSIQTSYGNGKMEAYDPESGERFTGEYSGFYEGQDAVYGTVGNQKVALVKPPTGANAFGVLIGDKATTIRLHFKITPGLRPTGYGIGSDENGNRYEVFF